MTSTSGGDAGDGGTFGVSGGSGGDGSSTDDAPPMDGSTGGTFGAVDDGGDGGDDDGGDDDGGDGSQPMSGPWSACPVNGGCGPGLSCIVSELIVASLCVESCEPAGDPSGCSPPPGGDSTPACLSVGSSSVCVLDCSSGQTCPGGMICHEEDGTAFCI